MTQDEAFPLSTDETIYPNIHTHVKYVILNQAKFVQMKNYMYICRICYSLLTIIKIDRIDRYYVYNIHKQKIKSVQIWVEKESSWKQ